MASSGKVSKHHLAKAAEALEMAYAHIGAAFPDNPNEFDAWLGDELNLIQPKIYHALRSVKQAEERLNRPPDFELEFKK